MGCMMCKSYKNVEFNNKRFYNKENESKAQFTYFDLQQKASHNSYEIGPIVQQIELNKARPFDGGCLTIELDLVQNHNKTGADDIWEFYLQHGELYKETSQRAEQALQDLKNWSTKNQNHDIITIFLDIKKECCFGEPQILAQKLNEMLLQNIGREKIFSPGDFAQGQKTLQERVQLSGYPLLEQMQGKFMFVMSGSESKPKVLQARNTYSEIAIEEALIFLDIDSRKIKPENLIDLNNFNSQSDNLPEDQPSYFLNRLIYNVPVKSKTWQQEVEVAKKKGYLTRVYTLKNKLNWDQSVNIGLNYLTVDNVFSKSCTEDFAMFQQPKKR